MRKIPTLYQRDWDGTVGPPGRLVLDIPNPECLWVLRGEGVATRKLDGTCCMVEGDRFYKRHEVRQGKDTPDWFHLVEVDDKTGKLIGWVPVGDGPEDKWHRAGLENTFSEFGQLADGTYELIGPHIQGNPENADREKLIAHVWGDCTPGAPYAHVFSPDDQPPWPYEQLKEWLAGRDVEGIVWQHADGRMAKIKGRDLGLKRGQR